MTHGAHPVRFAADRWRGSCASCGWWGLVCKSEDGAARSSIKHNVEATERDQRVHQYLYGPKAHRGTL